MFLSEFSTHEWHGTEKKTLVIKKKHGPPVNMHYFYVFGIYINIFTVNSQFFECTLLSGAG